MKVTSNQILQIVFSNLIKTSYYQSIGMENYLNIWSSISIIFDLFKEFERIKERDKVLTIEYTIVYKE